jgi:hypothetical protein
MTVQRESDHRIAETHNRSAPSAPVGEACGMTVDFEAIARRLSAVSGKG